MDILNQPKHSTLNLESRNQDVIRKSSGFTLIELLVVISTVAVLIALLLPALQRKREEYAANMATHNLTALIEAANVYHTRLGSYPNSIPELFQFCSANSGSCSLNSQLASGRTGGYLYMVDSTDLATWRIVAEPEFPGITGSLTLTINQNRMMTSGPTPGADAARLQAFNNILVSGARTVTALLALDSNATSQVRAYTGGTTINAGTLTNVFRLGDFDGDGDVDASDCTGFLTTDPNGPTYAPLTALKDAVTRELRLDTLDAQANQDIFVTMSDLDISQPSLFSYTGLRNLTRTISPASSDLIAKLDVAETSEANGNLTRKAKALRQYRDLVKQQTGTTFTRINASTLIAIAATL